MKSLLIILEIFYSRYSNLLYLKLIIVYEVVRISIKQSKVLINNISKFAWKCRKTDFKIVIKLNVVIDITLYSRVPGTSLARYIYVDSEPVSSSNLNYDPDIPVSFF